MFPVISYIDCDTGNSIGRHSRAHSYTFHRLRRSTWRERRVLRATFPLRSLLIACIRLGRGGAGGSACALASRCLDRQKCAPSILGSAKIWISFWRICSRESARQNAAIHIGFRSFVEAHCSPRLPGSVVATQVVRMSALSNGSFDRRATAVGSGGSFNRLSCPLSAGHVYCALLFEIGACHRVQSTGNWKCCSLASPSASS